MGWCVGMAADETVSVFQLTVVDSTGHRNTMRRRGGGEKHVEIASVCSLRFAKAKKMERYLDHQLEKMQQKYEPDEVDGK